MIGGDLQRDRELIPSASADSAGQLRREAAKARALADSAFGEEERRRLAEVAVMLEREANAIEAAILRRRRAEGPI